MLVNRLSALPWLQAARPVAHGMIALPLLWGQALALLVTGQFHWQWFIALHIYGLACQVYILYLNDYADEAVDKINNTYWFSGGSRVVPEGQLSGQQLYKASFIALAAMALIAMASSANGRPGMLFFLGLSAFAAWNYSLAPLRSSYRGYGELHQGLSCGVLLPLTAFYLQSGSLLNVPWLIMAPMFLVFYAGNIITALPDTPSDAHGGKRTYPVRHGEKKACRDALLLLTLAYSLCVIIMSTHISPFIMVGVIFGPAFILLGYIARTQLLITAGLANPAACKKFIALTTTSQVWIIVSWTGALFYLGLNDPSLFTTHVLPVIPSPT